MLKWSAGIVALAVLCCGAMTVLAWACDPPWGGINGVTQDSTLSGTVGLDVTVKSETKVEGVDLYVDGKLAGSLSDEPYKYDLDTTKLADDKHAIYAKVRADDRPDGKSDTISFTVRNQQGAAGATSDPAAAN